MQSAIDVLQANPQPYRVAYGRFAWSATAVARLADKRALRAPTGADVVDEETFIAASIAVARGIPFARRCASSAIPPRSNFLPPRLIKLTSAGATHGRDSGLGRGRYLADSRTRSNWLGFGDAMGIFRAALVRGGPDFAVNP